MERLSEHDLWHVKPSSWVIRPLEERIAPHRERVIKQYGYELHDEQIADVLRMEDCLRRCEGCKGLPCQNRYCNTMIPTVEVYGDYKVGVSTRTCDCMRRELRRLKSERILKSAQIPPRYMGKTLNDYTVDAHNREAVEWAKSAVKSCAGAFLYGRRGAGKTFLAAIVAQQLAAAGLTVTFIKVPALLSDIRDTFNGVSKVTETQLIEGATECDVLILDDFGMEKPTRFAGATLSRIIDARYDANLQTIVTSNYSVSKIETELNNATDGVNYNGSRIADRLNEMCRVLLLGGESRR